jgi:hypothetical protein
MLLLAAIDSTCAAASLNMIARQDLLDRGFSVLELIDEDICCLLPD